MQPYMNTRDNVFYTRLRDDIAEKANRITKAKAKELENQNEKMFGKLIHILKRERTSISKQRSQLGPDSLNVVTRKQDIKRINRDNIKISDILTNMTCEIPSMAQLKKREERNLRLKALASSRRVDGSPKVDPLV